MVPLRTDATGSVRLDYRLISDLVPHGARVLDLGCGDGSLIELVRAEKDAFVRGVELSKEGVAACIGRGLSVFQGDLDEGLEGFGDDTFDLVILSQTLQVVRNPALVMTEMLRVGRRGIVSFPNFGHWRIRGYLSLRGRMPVSRSIPYQWYETPNIHHTTLTDFRDFCRREGAVIEREIPLVLPGRGDGHVVRWAPNLRADTAVVVVRKA